MLHCPVLRRKGMRTGRTLDERGISADSLKRRQRGRVPAKPGEGFLLRKKKVQKALNGGGRNLWETPGDIEMQISNKTRGKGD